MKIRTAAIDDAAQIQRIYAPYVRDTAITFEYEIPDAEAFSGRIRKTLEEYPYLVAEDTDGRIAGYAYAGAFRTRAAYKHSAEVSIYIDDAYRGAGIGRALYRELERILAAQNIYMLYACITDTDRDEDVHLSRGSIWFHEKMGYTLVGRFKNCGYKFGQWYSMVWMEKQVREYRPHPDAFIPFMDLKRTDTTWSAHI